MRSESEAKIRSMVSLAESEPGIPIRPEDLDTDPWMLNVRNGTVDLRTGQILPHDPGRLITKLCPVEYDPSATCPTWLAFLDRIMDHNQDLLDFMQRAIGYSLTAITSEQVLFFLYGIGANGKSTLLNAIREMMGEDYAQHTPTEHTTTQGARAESPMIWPACGEPDSFQPLRPKAAAGWLNRWLNK